MSCHAVLTACSALGQPLAELAQSIHSSEPLPGPLARLAACARLAFATEFYPAGSCGADRPSRYSHAGAASGERVGVFHDGGYEHGLRTAVVWPQPQPVWPHHTTHMPHMLELHRHNCTVLAG